MQRLDGVDPPPLDPRVNDRARIAETLAVALGAHLAAAMGRWVAATRPAATETPAAAVAAADWDDRVLLEEMIAAASSG